MERSEAACLVNYAAEMDLFGVSDAFSDWRATRQSLGPISANGGLAMSDVGSINSVMVQICRPPPMTALSSFAKRLLFRSRKAQ